MDWDQIFEHLGNAAGHLVTRAQNESENAQRNSRNSRAGGKRAPRHRIAPKPSPSAPLDGASCCVKDR